VVCGDLSKQQYVKTLEFAIRYSQSFGVSVFKSIHKKHLRQSYFDFFATMEPYEEDKYQFLLQQHYEKGQSFRIFPLNDVSKAFLKKYESFWDWALPDLPEDLSFYRNNKVWLNCITHERMMIVDTQDPIVLSFLNSLGVHLRLYE
jgi:hypothetical protein